MEIIQPRSHDHWLRLRLEVITSTEIAALFNESPYLTEFELWHQKKNKQINSIEENERMFWGNILEESIAKGVCQRNGWTGEPFKIFGVRSRIGSSFDWKIQVEGKECLLEIKNVDGLVFRDDWTNPDGTIEPPTHIDLQAQHQMLVSGIDTCYIAALVGGNDLKIIKREANKNIQEMILDKTEKFWQSIESNVAPSPNFEEDAAFIMKMNQDVDEG